MVDIPKTDYKIQLTIKSPLELLYRGVVEALTFFNESGKFDVPLHANLISIIKDKVIIYEKSNTQKEIKIEEGIVKIFENNVDIFIGVKSIS
ncbi:MAG: hypothetical protein E6H08_19900 [Bacteroidetes bacterium]|nr:MAG: hypothetical protein E6H08_19900 [Bacteroidota bacterium]